METVYIKLICGLISFCSCFFFCFVLQQPPFCVPCDDVNIMYPPVISSSFVSKHLLLICCVLWNGAASAAINFCNGYQLVIIQKGEKKCSASKRSV